VGDPPPNSASHSDQLWNRAALLIHQALFRVAWIFKTESVIMPAFLDTISESGLIRGALPLLNRAGQSLAPLLLAQQLSRTPLKKLWLSRTTFLMGAPFLFLSACIWLGNAQLPPAFAFVFLTAYVVFFCMHGINEMTASTVLGKLIAATQRGRLQAAASAIGTTAAVSLALLLLSRWLQPPGQAPFQQIFCFVGSVMMLAGISSRLLREPPDLTATAVPQPASTAFRRTCRLLKDDPVLRRLCLVAVLFIFSQTIFPHYQSIGLARSGRSRTVLMHWVVAQHIGAVCFSAASGFLADRTGVRSALRHHILLDRTGARDAPHAGQLRHRNHLPTTTPRIHQHAQPLHGPAVPRVTADRWPCGLGRTRTPVHRRRCDRWCRSRTDLDHGRTPHSPTEN